MIVPRVRTPLDREGMRAALQAGHHQHFGMPCNREREACALAMACIEHANGAAIWCFNFGNIDATADWTGDAFALAADEVLDGKRARRTKLLRAHACAEDGAADFWRFLAERFELALIRFDDGDPIGAAHALKRGGWYTGSEADYAKAMHAIFLEVYDAA